MITDEQAQANKEGIQQEGVQLWVDNGYRGTLAYATGVGKTRTAILCIKKLRILEGFNNGLLVVPTEEMRDVDWPDEFAKWNCSIDGIKTICYASLAAEDLNKYDFIVYDECHRLTLHNLQKLYYFKGPRLGLTATFPNSAFPEDQEIILMMEELLPPVHTVKTDDAVDLGLISDFEVMVIQFYLDNVNKNIPSGTKKKPRMATEKGHYGYLTKMMQIAVIKKLEGLKFAAISKRTQFIYNLPSKMRLAKECLERLVTPENPRRTLVLCGSIEQAEEICKENVFHSRSLPEALEKFQRKEIDILGAVKALNEGKNLIDLEQELILQVDSQERNLVQRIGRAVRKRPGKPDFKARIVILVALLTADEKWFKSAIKRFDSKRISHHTVRVPDVKKSEDKAVA